MHASCLCRNKNDYKPCVYSIYIICATVSEDTCNLVHVVLSVRTGRRSDACGAWKGSEEKEDADVISLRANMYFFWFLVAVGKRFRDLQKWKWTEGVLIDTTSNMCFTFAVPFANITVLFYAWNDSYSLHPSFKGTLCKSLSPKVISHWP
jgi:hypothetical protein